MYSFDRAMRARGPATYTPRTSLREGIEYVASDYVNRGWSIGMFVAHSDLRQRNGALRSLAYDTDVFPEDVLDRAIPSRNPGMLFDGADSMDDGIDYEYLAQYANSNGYRFASQKAIEERVRQRVKENYDKKIEAYANAPTHVRAAMNITGLGMAVADPIYLPTYLIGGPVSVVAFRNLAAFRAIHALSKGAPKALTTVKNQMRLMTGKKALGFATMEAGAESINQAIQYKWNNAVGIKYTAKDMALAVGITFGVAGFASMAADAGMLVIDKYLKKMKRAGAKAADVAEAENFAMYLDGHKPGTTVEEAIDKQVSFINREADSVTSGPLPQSDADLMVDPSYLRKSAKTMTEDMRPTVPSVEVGRAARKGFDPKARGLDMADQLMARMPGEQVGDVVDDPMKMADIPDMPDKHFDNEIGMTDSAPGSDTPVVKRTTARRIVAETHEMLQNIKVARDCLTRVA